MVVVPLLKKNSGKYDTVCNIPVVSLCAEFNKPQKEGAPQDYSCITIDSSSQVTDHYTLKEKLGV